jgi:hypothetical protein
MMEIINGSDKTFIGRIKRKGLIFWDITSALQGFQWLEGR